MASVYRKELSFVVWNKNTSHFSVAMNCDHLKCPFWDNGQRFSCAKTGSSCWKVMYPDLLTRVNITFVGDSLSGQHFNSMSCMLWSRCKRHTTYVRFVSNTQQRCRSICGSHLCMQNAGTRYGAEHSTAYYLQLFENVSDFQVYNEGLWWNSHASAMAKFDAFIAVFSMLSEEKKRRIIWRETSPQHFRNGTWSTWYKREACQPLTNMSNPWTDVSRRAQGRGCRVLNVWDMTAFAWSEHLAQKTNHTKGKGVDCTHYCEPGVIDAWSNRLWHTVADVLGA